MGDRLYKDVVIEHCRRPRNRGRLEGPDARAHVRSPACGDELDVTLAVDRGRITDVRFEGRGCAISQALASIASERYPGMLVEDVLALDGRFTADLLGSEVSSGRLGCATLHLTAIQRALAGCPR